MKKTAFIFILIIWLFVSVNGQKNKEQVSKADKLESNNWKTFVAEDKSFKVLFPKSPQQIVSKLFTFGGLLDPKKSKRYFSSMGKVTYFIGFSDYSAPFKDELELKAKYESMLLFSPDKEVYVQNHVGVEKSEKVRDAEKMFNVSSVNAIYRVFIIKQRLFIIAAFIPTKYSSSQNEKKAFRQRADKFFDSLTIMKIPPAKHSPSPLLPNDYEIYLVDPYFICQKLKLRITIPLNWKTWTYKPVEKMISDEESGYSGLNSYLSQHKKRIRKRLFISTSEYSEFWLTVHRREFPDSSVKEIAHKMANVLSVESKTQIIKGRKFEVVETRKFFESEGLVFTSRRYFTEWNGFILEIGIGFNDNSQLRLLEKSINSLSRLEK